MTTTTTRHARPRRGVLTGYIHARIERAREWYDREPVDLDGAGGVGSRWTPDNDMAAVTAWRDGISPRDPWSQDRDRATRQGLRPVGASVLRAPDGSALLDVGGVRLVPGDARVPAAMRATHTGTDGVSDDELSAMYRSRYAGEEGGRLS